jgi:lipooligosaccharide transport system permease protein
MTAPALSVLEYNLVSYRRTWRGSALSSFVLPVLFVIGFGISVGSLVDAGGKLGNESYLQFIVPGMIASTAMQVGFGEATFPVMAKLQWIKTYHAMIAAPLRVRDILAGDMAFLVVRIVSTSAVFLLVTALFGAVASWWSLLVLPITALIGLAFAAPMFAVCARVDTTVYFSFIQRFLIIPMSLFAGVFFKVSSLGWSVRWLAYVSPLWHGVELCRAATSIDHGSLLAAVGHLAYLTLWAVVGLWLAYRSFIHRLSD